MGTSKPKNINGIIIYTPVINYQSPTVTKILYRQNGVQIPSPAYLRSQQEKNTIFLTNYLLGFKKSDLNLNMQKYHLSDGCEDD